jgi:hypothetical protein
MNVAVVVAPEVELESKRSACEVSGESVPAQDFGRRIGIALPGARWLVEPVALFPGRLAGLVMPFPSGLATLMARGRLRIGVVLRSR